MQNLVFEPDFGVPFYWLFSCFHVGITPVIQNQCARKGQLRGKTSDSSLWIKVSQSIFQTSLGQCLKTQFGDNVGLSSQAQRLKIRRNRLHMSKRWSCETLQTGYTDIMGEAVQHEERDMEKEIEETIAEAIFHSCN